MHIKHTVLFILAFSLLSGMAARASDHKYEKAMNKCPADFGPEAIKCRAEVIATRDQRKRAEQEELTNRPATGTGVYRCVSGDGRRHTRDKQDIRLGEFCGELTREEVGKMKAEANRPPTNSEKSQMTTRAQRMEHWDRCVEAGRVLRQANQTPRQQYWTDAVLAAAQVLATDHG